MLLNEENYEEDKKVNTKLYIYIAVAVISILILLAVLFKWLNKDN